MSASGSPRMNSASLPSLRRNSSSRSTRPHQPASPRASAMDSDLSSPNSMMPQRHHQREGSTDRAVREENEAVLRSWEAEEERLTNQLTRKLERLRVDRAKLEQDLEAESEAMVLRLQRQLAMLQQQQQQQSQSSPEVPISPNPSHSAALTQNDPVVESLKSENASLRERLTQAEREFNKQLVTASNYRRELHQLRTRLGMDTSDLTATLPSPSPNKLSLSSGTTTSNSSIHDVLASPDFTCEPHASWSGHTTNGTTPSDASYSTPLVPINTPAQSYVPPSQWGMSPPPAPAPSLSSSVQDSHAYHPHPQQIQPGYRRVVEEGQLERRTRRSASIASTTLNNVAEDDGQTIARDRNDEDLVAGEME